MFALRFCSVRSILCALCVLAALPASSQSVSVGAGSYATTLPPGALGPSNVDGLPIAPLVSDGFNQPIQTNDFWSSLLFPFFNDLFSGPLFAHPIGAKATPEGLQIGYTPTSTLAADDYLYPYAPQMNVGVSGLAAANTTVDGYGDWTVTARWEGGTALTATLGHGLPYVFFERSGSADARIVLFTSPTIWADEGNVLGLTVAGRHYGIFGPTGSDWEGFTTLTSSLGGEDYFSVALLPDATQGTLDLFRAHAYAFVTDSRVNWVYDEDTATLSSVYSYETVEKETGPDLSGETMTALYRHQWLHTVNVTTGLTYQSPRGEMRLFEGNSFGTEQVFGGVLPALPDLGDYDPDALRALVQQVTNETLPVIPTYESGKSMGRFARLVHIADQLGQATERDYFLDQIKARLEDWFTAGGAQQYVYDDTWDVLTGYPASFGSDTQINDHHFHHGYAIMAAATVAQYDPEWAAPENWGGMVNLLIKDAANPDRTDEQFPFLRSFDVYAGHAWASGHGAFGDGNNQESSSESMQFAAATILWGEMTGQPDLRDLGIYLYTTEATAVEQYWFDVDNEVFPSDYGRIALGLIWGSKGSHATFFGNEPEFIHGINILPITGGSLYLGRRPEYVSLNYDTVVSENGGPPDIWPDVLWSYLALSEPDRALDLYVADPNYEPFDGESRAHTRHWLYNLVAMGQVDTEVTADVPTYAVFLNDDGLTTFVAFNADDVTRTVTFSNGFELQVPARSLAFDNNPIVDDEPSASAPDRFEVFPNAPNPFADRTTIRYALPAASAVTLEVFDALGRKVLEMAEPVRAAGRHAVEIDASALPSGAYFCRVRASDFAQTIPMTVLR